MKKLTLHDLSLNGARVVLRVDFNVPLDDQGAITDTTRIDMALPSIEYIIAQGASLVLMSHLGRPDGKPNPKYSLKPCADYLQQRLGKPVTLAPDCIGVSIEDDITLLENLRFHKEEEAGDEHFAKQLAQYGDIYVNDAFGTAHRKHASTCTIASFFPKKAAAGFLLEKEVSALSSLINTPKRPFFTLIGGAKVASKIGVLTSLIEKVDSIFIGGGMVFTFLKAAGHSIGSSLCDESFIEKAADFLKECSSRAIKVMLPKDIVVASSIDAQSEHKVINLRDGIDDGWSGVDIGPETVKEWSQILSRGSTIFWNGPLGVCEIEPFARGTKEIATCLASVDGTTIVGGGDSVAAINALHLSKNFTHISTGGGASLEFIEKGSLPGIEALTDR